MKQNKRWYITQIRAIYLTTIEDLSKDLIKSICIISSDSPVWIGVSEIYQTAITYLIYNK